MGFQPPSVRQINRVGRDVVDGGVTGIRVGERVRISALSERPSLSSSPCRPARSPARVPCPPRWRAGSPLSLPASARLRRRRDALAPAVSEWGSKRGRPLCGPGLRKIEPGLRMLILRHRSDCRRTPRLAGLGRSARKYRARRTQSARQRRHARKSAWRWCCWQRWFWQGQRSQARRSRGPPDRQRASKHSR